MGIFSIFGYNFKHHMRILFLLVLLSISGFLHANVPIDSLIYVLESTMEKRSEYDAQKEKRILELKKLLNKEGISQGQAFFIKNQLIDEYSKYIFDSAVSYLLINIQLAQEIQNREMMNELNVSMADIMASSGKYFEAFDILNDIDQNSLSVQLKVKYFKALIKTYNEISFHSPCTDFDQKYSNKVIAYTDSIMPYLDPQSEDYLAILEKKYRDGEKFSKSLEINTHRLALSEMGSRVYSQITYERSLLYRLMNKQEEEMKYYCLSAISDIMGSNKDNASLTELALLLHRKGDVDRANKFIKFSYDDAVFFKSELRFKLLSEILPIIKDAYQFKIEKQQNRLSVLLLISGFLLMALIVSLFLILRQVAEVRKKKNELFKVNKQLKELNKDLADTNDQLQFTNLELSESNHVKEHYIGNFLTICSDYIYKLDRFNKKVNKQLANRKIEDLFAETKSKKLIDAEIKEFYENFDKAFLHIFPNFLTDFNQLLLDGEQIELKSEERLNTELRIFALIRLGINESAQIAKLLRYSVNTIYNYRVKIKNKAKGERESFENEVMRIDAVKQ